MPPKDDAQRHARWVVAAVVVASVLVFAAGISCAILLSQDSDREEQRRIDSEFDLAAAGTFRFVEQGLTAYVDSIAHAGQGLARDDHAFVPIGEFNLQAKFLQGVRPGLNSISLGVRVEQGAQRISYEADYNAGFPIAVVNPLTFQPEPASSEVPVLWPLAYSILRPAAQGSSQTLDGLDLYSMPPFQGYLDDSTTTGRCQTGKFISILDGLRLLGIMCPIYSKSIVPFNTSYTADQRVNETFGAMVVTVRTQELVETPLFESVPADTAVLLEDMTVDNFDSGAALGVVLLRNDSSQFVTSFANQGGAVSNILLSQFEAFRSKGRSSSATLLFGQRELHMTLVALPEFERSRSTSNASIILSAGLIVSCVVVGVIVIVAWAMSARERAISATAIYTERTKRMVAEAQQLAHEKTLGYAAHELRNPLHAISASAEFLAEAIDPSDPAHEDVQAIVAGSQQMHRLVNDVLDWGKLRAGKLSLSPLFFDVRDMLRELLSLHSGMTQPGVALCSYVDPAVPHKLFLDNLRMRQLISNGLTNSLKMTRSGAIMLRVTMGSMLVPADALDSLGRPAGAGPASRSSSATPRTAASEHDSESGLSAEASLTDGVTPKYTGPPVMAQCVLFEVVDTGPGLKGADARALFEPFVQHSAAPSVKQEHQAATRPFQLRVSENAVASPLAGKHPYPRAVAGAGTGVRRLPVHPSAGSARSLAGPSPLNEARQRRIRPSVSYAKARSSKSRSTKSGAHAHAKQGTGLGLPICKQLVSLMAGHMFLEDVEVDPRAVFPSGALPQAYLDSSPEPRVTAFWFCVPLPPGGAGNAGATPSLESILSAIEEVDFSADVLGDLSPSSGVRVAPSNWRLAKAGTGAGAGAGAGAAPATAPSSAVRAMPAVPAAVPAAAPLLAHAPVKASKLSNHKHSTKASSESSVELQVSEAGDTVAKPPPVLAPRLSTSEAMFVQSFTRSLSGASAPEAQAKPGASAAPTRRKDVDAVAPSTARSKSSSSLASGRRAAKRAKLGLSCVVVDDEFVNRRVCQRMLTKLGCTTVLLEDGDQLLDQLHSAGYGAASPSDPGFKPYDCILLDIMMERSNGVDVLREAQAAFPATCPTPLPPCFAVTGNASVQEVCSYTEAGFADVLPKPFSMETLRTALVHLVADR